MIPINITPTITNEFQNVAILGHNLAKIRKTSLLWTSKVFFLIDVKIQFAKLKYLKLRK